MPRQARAGARHRANCAWSRCAASIEHLEGLFERIRQHGELRTSIVMSTQFADRPVEPAAEEFLHATPSPGWSNRPQRPAVRRAPG
jgi:hypothetical protein